jgi:hypothetical protein
MIREVIGLAQRIKCKVEECAYNDSYLCRAEEIEVRSSGENRVVNSTDGTACETFKPKDATLINPEK